MQALKPRQFEEIRLKDNEGKEQDVCCAKENIHHYYKCKEIK